MHLFYTQDLNQQENYTLSEEESRHCCQVLRLNQGDVIHLINGTGGFYTAVILNANPKATQLKITGKQQEYGKRNYYIHIAVAPTKNIERFEWFLEKATEIGIDEITPIICDRSERREIKTERLNKVITSAVKQSIKAYYPRLNEVVKFKDFVKKASPALKFIAHCMDGEKFTLKDKFKPKELYLVLIGPEGDFSPGELDEALTNGFFPISLGVSRLRTETAALESCFELNFLNR
jgi:16S rRNA (uracil1498-N3)-methyltransferase